MSIQKIRQLICGLLVVLVVMGIVAHIIQDQQRTDTCRKLALQNVELKETVDSLTEQVKQEELYISDLERQTRDRQTISRGGERPAYNLTPSERNLVEQVVMAEAAGEPYEGQMLVAQCVLNACKKDGIRPAEAVDKYVYARSRPEPSISVVKAVEAVFDRGITMVDEPVIYFYAPGRVQSEFHESQRFICEVGGHRFFAEAD